MQPHDWLTRTATIVLLKHVSCDCIGEILVLQSETSEILAQFKQQQRRRSTQYVGKTLPIYCYHVLFLFFFQKLLRGYEERL